MERIPPPFNPVGEGYRYLLLTIITIAVLLTSTVLVLGAASRPQTQVVQSAVPTMAPMPGMGATQTATTSTAASIPAKPVTAAEISRAAADVPAPITRSTPTTIVVNLETKEVTAKLDEGQTYTYWTFGGTVPGPMLRVLVGDTVELHLKNAQGSVMAHSIDLHAVNGPGGGATATMVSPGQEAKFTFKALNPGLYVYHCATGPIPMHIINGMFGMILVEPRGGLPKVDHEYYVMQSELYTTTPFGTPGHHEFSNDKLLAETPDYVLFNGRVGALTGAGALKAKVGETVRIYFGVGGFVDSNFHLIGEIFDRVYPDGALAQPLENVQTTLVPAGGAMAVEFKVNVPGRYTLVDHALPRALNRGAAGYLEVEGESDPTIFDGALSGPGH
ncbi:MAG TPA: copper-containing nitrite reductase [Candidatus Limnocylindria bacterium]|jgi:nitrite reductase (NO-forming)|nr:copper-containing nitrite reductase [Candidatus Limnocylindria bacterium]